MDKRGSAEHIWGEVAVRRRTWGKTRTHGLAIGRRSRGFLRKEHGAAAIEYAVLLAVLALVAIGSIRALGARANSLHTSLAHDVAGVSAEFSNSTLGGVTMRTASDEQR